MKRYIYAFDTVTSAREAILLLRGVGVEDKSISLIAKSDIAMDEIPDRFIDVSHDIVPAIGRGAAIGGATGFVAGLAAMAIPPLGIAVGGAALIGFFTGGALLGAWSSSLIGASVPDEIRRKFEAEIADGRVLLVVDSNEDNDARMLHALTLGSDRHLLWQSALDVAPA